MTIRSIIPWIGMAALVVGAAFDFPGRDSVLVGFLLFLPLVDPGWRPASVLHQTGRALPWTVAGLLLGGGLVVLNPEVAPYALATLVFAALPEEWYFRAYLMGRFGASWRTNVAIAVFFSLLHSLVWGWPVGVQVFLPSLAFGWIYLRWRDLPLTVVVHALSNLVFQLYLSAWLDSTWGNL